MEKREKKPWAERILRVWEMHARRGVHEFHRKFTESLPDSLSDSKTD
jgi:hypothetical protein